MELWVKQFIFAGFAGGMIGLIFGAIGIPWWITFPACFLTGWYADKIITK